MELASLESMMTVLIYKILRLLAQARLATVARSIRPCEDGAALHQYVFNGRCVQLRVSAEVE